ncbi:MAG: phosphoglycerate kinase [Candidatus Lloydbacteria bacterium RIFCSPHIGHO2_02_FULL_54_17]|uniref:Phosphoglycerate kinase n=1 Tax=Candidatus Lloydbacteria bacterium RIFCSPHIGHO2_02_FULL_54_17 TaxID=1798664 RepID=A0A1G2DIG2_9BACT|nr:MAG: phosphoglycerate kinase [Candidatus Lloydbacteria bacterium RIFCSPHIGHO2_01_FULL_54_11]OGZ13293.1 MAG: phosphoglycerate kinase [Candidatus Lloydbacteria bacterium RIFCSPHIGHO2_02_FULL_54_17]
MPIFKVITEYTELRGKRILLRLDLNVPLEEGEVRDAYRIEQSLATIDFLRKEGARVVIMSHIGKGKPEDTLLPVAKYLNKKFPVTFLDQPMSTENVRMVGRMEDGDVVLLENLRHEKGEEANDPEFARAIAALGDIYVNDAFAVSHRAHASVVGIPLLLPSYAGILFAEEVRRLSVALAPKHPFLFIVGGAKISTKMPLLKKFLETADYVFVGGALANNFFKVAGHEIGKSVYDETELKGLKELLDHERLIIPSDVIVKNEGGSEPRRLDSVTKSDMIVDIGPESVRNMEAVIGSAALIVWNGPLGYYEAGFTNGTREFFLLITNAQATSIVGGGDTVALINEMHLLDRFSFVSTGGGAMLDFLQNETLPGIEALLHK